MRTKFSIYFLVYGLSFSYPCYSQEDSEAESADRKTCSELLFAASKYLTDTDDQFILTRLAQQLQNLPPEAEIETLASYLQGGIFVEIESFQIFLARYMVSLLSLEQDATSFEIGLTSLVDEIFENKERTRLRAGKLDPELGALYDALTDLVGRHFNRVAQSQSALLDNEVLFEIYDSAFNRWFRTDLESTERKKLKRLLEKTGLLQWAYLHNDYLLAESVDALHSSNAPSYENDLGWVALLSNTIDGVIWSGSGAIILSDRILEDLLLLQGLRMDQFAREASVFDQEVKALAGEASAFSADFYEAFYWIRAEEDDSESEEESDLAGDSPHWSKDTESRIQRLKERLEEFRDDLSLSHQSYGNSYTDHDEMSFQQRLWLLSDQVRDLEERFGRFKKMLEATENLTQRHVVLHQPIEVGARHYHSAYQFTLAMEAEVINYAEEAEDIVEVSEHPERITVILKDAQSRFHDQVRLFNHAMEEAADGYEIYILADSFNRIRDAWLSLAQALEDAYEGVAIEEGVQEEIDALSKQIDLIGEQESRIELLLHSEFSNRFEVHQRFLRFVERLRSRGVDFRSLPLEVQESLRFNTRFGPVEGSFDTMLEELPQRPEAEWFDTSFKLSAMDDLPAMLNRLERKLSELAQYENKLLEVFLDRSLSAESRFMARTILWDLRGFRRQLESALTENRGVAREMRIEDSLLESLRRSQRQARRLRPALLVGHVESLTDFQQRLNLLQELSFGGVDYSQISETEVEDLTSIDSTDFESYSLRLRGVFSSTNP